MDLKTSILYENGCATLIQLDYQMDITSIMKKKKKKNGMIVRKDDAVKSPKNEDCYSNKLVNNIAQKLIDINDEYYITHWRHLRKCSNILVLFFISIQNGLKQSSSCKIQII